MEAILKEVTFLQRAEVASILHAPMTNLAKQCAVAWPERERLNQALLDGFPNIPYCTYLYIVNQAGIQMSDNVGAQGVEAGSFGRDRSGRPYMREPVPEWGFLLSDSYLSLSSKRPSITALHVLLPDGQMVGYVGADFDLRNLPMAGGPYPEPDHWRQIKGDPSIRQLLFQQTRVESSMDRGMENALSILEELLTERGVFQSVIHFSSSRATVWTMDDPYRYHLLDQEALADPDICLAYPRQTYSAEVSIPAEKIKRILSNMGELRLADDTIYLRSASINLFNGMISLTFSCDGSHYMRYDEFLEKDLAFWFGNPK